MSLFANFIQETLGPKSKDLSGDLQRSLASPTRNRSAPWYRPGAPVPAVDPPVGELVDHEEGVRLQHVDVVEVVADGARQRRLPDLLQLLEGQRAARVRVVAVLVPEPDEN